VKRTLPAAIPRAYNSDGMRRATLLTISLVLTLLASASARVYADAPGDTQPAARAEPVSLTLSAPVPVADEVIVRKSERRLYLLRHGEVFRSYHVALGLSPNGPKERAGDFRTPEGRYQLTRRNARSDYFLSIQVSYPNEDDLRRARMARADPGGAIMLHGLPNAPRHPLDFYARADWTDGCIAMSDADMVEVWLMTQDNIPIEILP